MKKTKMALRFANVFAGLFLTISANAQTGPQILSLNDNGTLVSTSPYLLNDSYDCDYAIRDFQYMSARPLWEYLRCDNDGLGKYVWKVDCRLYDVTTTPFTLLADDHSLYNIGDPGCTDAQAAIVESDIDDQKGNEGITDPDGYLKFAFNGIHLQNGHVYGVNLRIINYSNPGFGGALDQTLQTDENSQQIKIGWNGMYTTNTWNRDILQPSFTNMSVGTIAGNFAGNNEGYLIGQDNKVYNVVWSNNQWNIWCLDPNFANAAPGGITVNPNNGEVYFIGTDNKVYNAVWTNNQWNIWCLDPNFTSAAPGGITVNPNNGEVYFVGIDGKVYNAVWANNQWNIWVLDPNFTSAAPGGITVNPNNGEVYFIGTDNKVYNAVWANNQWNTWVLDPNFTNAAPGGISVNPNDGEVYFIGTDNKVYNAVWANNQWNTWVLDANFANAAPGAIVAHPTSGFVYFIGTDNMVYNAVWSNNQWNIWTIDANYAEATPGSIGVLLKNKGSELWDMVFDVNGKGQLDAHIWPSCVPEPKERKIDTATTGVSLTQAETHSLLISPNPMINRATVSFTIGTTSTNDLSLYNITGQKVKEIVNGSLGNGFQTYTIQRDGLPAGLYFVVLKTDGQSQVQKLVVQ